MIEIVQEKFPDLAGYSLIPIAFEVHEVVDVTAAQGVRGGHLPLRRVRRPYVKDYDATDDERPVHWPTRFDVSSWGFFKASRAGIRVGGAAVAVRTPDLDTLEGRTDLAVLWDIRVAPQARRQGVGAALFGAAVAWASAERCRELKIETQDINATACRFYARQGCVLRSVHRGVYQMFPDELQLLWYKTLAHGATNQ